jgi:Cu+-exporting ATPase
LLQAAPSLERASEHSLAAAILAAAKEKGIQPLAVEDFQSVTGKGI